MDVFEGFYEQTNDYLIGIRFNNCKEWFHSHKDEYSRYVQQPMKAFADEIFAAMRTLDPDFNELPKVSRANRDIRFSKNKNPYKESKWFFLRGDGSPHIVYSKPTYYFEITPDYWWYGVFFAPGPNGMANYRKRLDADPAGFERLIDDLNGYGVFVTGGEEYKRIFNKDVKNSLMPYYQKKDIMFYRKMDYGNMDFYSPKLKDIVADDFKKLYPMYRFLNNTAMNTELY